MKKIVLSWVLCVLGLVALVVWLGNSTMGNRVPVAEGGGLITAEFELVSAENKVVRAEDLRGKYLLVYFGFTHCPDICPTTLLLVNNVLSQLEDTGENVVPIFISVDPERDTPQVAAEYAKHFGPQFLGLSGTPEQVKAAAESFKVYYSKVEDKGSALGYVVDHSSFLYLMGPDGNYLTHFPHQVAEQELKQGLQRYVR
jgi:protein SCO1/2